MNSLRTFSRYFIFPGKRTDHNLLSSLKVLISYYSETFNEQFKLSENDHFYNKIIYNEILVKVPVRKKSPNRPIFLKYLSDKNTDENTEAVNKIEAEQEIISFPFDVRTKFLPGINTKDETTEGNAVISDEAEPKEREWKTHKYKIDKDNLEDPHKWNIISLMDDKIDDIIKFGSCDSSIPVSKVPCGGCGASLHCNDASIPGFLPKEVFDTSNKEELRGQICQRCHFLRIFNVALGVNVSSSQYEQIISKINNKKICLVIYMIDLLDFPCSIYPDIFNLIGPKNPVVVVGNKVDLLMQEDSEFLSNFKESLLNCLREKNFNVENVKHVAMISAKTGYGVEELISTLQSSWGNQGDVYLIGCANVGKSSLFNTLIQSDYCRVNASDILQRATVSAWPGTTLNLLKFPISKVVPWQLAARQNRLLMEEKQKFAIQRLQYGGQNIRLQQIPLAEYVGRTFKNVGNTGNSNQAGHLVNGNEVKKGINPRSHEFALSKWFYDTPGVIHCDQILNLFTTSELLLTLPTEMLIPRNFRMKEGHSLFIGGIARLDYISGPKFVWFTVFASRNLPITITKLKDADLVYQKLLGSPLFRVPAEGKERLSKWPALASKKIEICGKLPRNFSYEENFNTVEKKEADADIVLSSAGWVAITVRPPYRCIIEAWTPEGRGIHVRKVPIIKKGHIFRGERIENTPGYKSNVKQVPGYTINDEPPF